MDDKTYQVKLLLYEEPFYKICGDFETKDLAEEYIKNNKFHSFIISEIDKITMK